MDLKKPAQASAHT